MTLSLVVAALAGCSSTGGVSQLSTTRSLSGEAALVFPPPGGPAVVAVVERRYRNGIEQDISLNTRSSVAGQNSIKVRFVGPDIAGVNTDKSLSSASLTDLTVSREMRKEMPGVVMTRSPSYFQNNYGPFGYAVGRSRGGDTCVYGWQQVRSREAARSALSNLGMIQLRLRLCDVEQTEQALLATMYGYTINGSFTGWQWNPYGPPGKVDENLGAVGHPVYPATAAIDHYAAPLGYEPRPVPRRTVSTSQPARAAVIRQPAGATAPAVGREPLPNPTGPLVPAPPTVGTPSASLSSSNADQVSTIKVPTPDCAGSGGACP